MVDHENILTRKFFARNFLTRKFPELRYILQYNNWLLQTLIPEARVVMACMMVSLTRSPTAGWVDTVLILMV